MSGDRTADAARLAEALREHHSTSDGRTVDGKLHFVCSCGALYRGGIADHVAAALLPTVDAIATGRAAPGRRPAGRPNPSLGVTCPRCGAESGDNCITREGRLTETHRERRQVAHP